MSFNPSTGTEAALRRWAFEPNRTAATQPARDAYRRRYAAQVDPDGVLDEDDRERRIDNLIRADMISMARRRWNRRA